MGYVKVEEKQAVGMRCWGFLVGGWVGGEIGWDGR